MQVPPSEEATLDDAMVCYCYRLTTGKLREAYNRCGSLAKMQDETKAGRACRGCNVVLQALFGEEATVDIPGVDRPVKAGTPCMIPGSNAMKGFIIANDQLDSVVYSSNAVAPQLGACDSTTPVEYALIDGEGKVVFHRRTTIRTNETFVFDTRNEDIPRPFYGMFHMSLGRGNIGASRFNIYWTDGKYSASTHEQSGSWRPRVFLPIVVDQAFIDRELDIYFAIMNPYGRKLPYTARVSDVETEDQLIWSSELDAEQSVWINVTETMFKPMLAQYPGSTAVIEFETPDLNVRTTLSLWFFIHHRKQDLWTANHI